jgi:hypothetical protein
LFKERQVIKLNEDNIEFFNIKGFKVEVISDDWYDYVKVYKDNNLICETFGNFNKHDIEKLIDSL